MYNWIKQLLKGKKGKRSNEDCVTLVEIEGPICDYLIMKSVGTNYSRAHETN